MTLSPLKLSAMAWVRNLLAVAIALTAYPALAEGQALSDALPPEPPARQIAPQEPGDAVLSPQMPIRILAASPACAVATVRRGGKVEDIYWTNGPYQARVTTNEADHYVDLNLVIRTSGYRRGDCIEARLTADDGEDIAMQAKEIVLRGQANEIGYVFFEAPMRRYTVISR